MSRDLILLALSLMTWGLGEGMFLFFQAPYLEQLGAGSLQIGRILGLVGTAMAVTHIPAGYLSDRIGRKPMLITAWSIGTISTAIMALATSLPLFVVGAILYGTTAFVMTPMNSYITHARQKLSVARALTMLSAAYSFGFIVGPWLGGIIGERFSLRTNFQVGAVIFVFSTAIMIFIKPQPVESATQRAQQISAGFLANKKFLLFLALIFLTMFGMYLPQPFSQLFLLNQAQLDLAKVGSLVSISSIGVVVLNLTLGRINPRVGFLLAQAGVAIFALCLWRGNSYLIFALGYFLLGSYRTARSLASAQGRELVHARNMGIAYGLIETTSALAVILAPVFASYLYTNQPSSIYSVSLFLILLGIGAMLLFSPLRQHKFSEEEPVEN